MSKVVSLVLLLSSSVNGFVSHSRDHNNRHYYGYCQNSRTTKQLSLRSNNSKKNEDIVDVEFERVYARNTVDSGDSSEDKNGRNKNQEQKETGTNGKSLFDLSFDSTDPEFRDMRIPFVDEGKMATSNNKNDGSGGGQAFIEGKLAFIVDLDGVSYGIAVPCDHCAAITKENLKEGTVENQSPEYDENEKNISIMAKNVLEQLNEKNDEDDVEGGKTGEKKKKKNPSSKVISLKRTPKILTISGNLTKYTRNWETELLPTMPIDPETLMDDSDEDLDFFYDFMKSELGEGEFERTKRQIRQQQQANNGLLDIDEDLVDLFNVPGFGTEENDEEGIKKMMSNFYDIEKEEKKPIL